jgi:hypothetical protein
VIFAIAVSIAIAILVLNDLHKRMIARRMARQQRDVPKPYRNNKTNWKMAFLLLVGVPIIAIVRAAGSESALTTYKTLSPETQSIVDTALLWLPLIFRLGIVLLLLLAIAYVYFTLKFQWSQDATFELIENQMLRGDWSGTREEIDRLLRQEEASIKATMNPLLLNYQHGLDAICGHWSEANALLERQKTLAPLYEFGVTFDAFFLRAQGQLEQAELLAHERKVDDGVGRLALAVILFDQNKPREAARIVDWLDRVLMMQLSPQEKSILKVIHKQLVELGDDEPNASATDEYRDTLTSAVKAILVLDCHLFRVKWHSMTRRISVAHATSINQVG